MAKEFIRYALMFIILVVAQAVVFNHLCLFNVAVPLVFVYFIIKLPTTLNVGWVITLSFLIGFTVDIFSNSPGMNALACTICGALRLPVLRLYYPREEDMSDPEPSARTLGAGTFMKYAGTATAIYCLLFFFIEAFAFHDWLLMLVRAAASAMLTFVIILAIDSLTASRR
ncbi:MAG: rod shape-determining protein MreD [Muribaculaceae bacterium]|nr:rod shape-determining protein MreD [Muribaculaceae bacterium]